MGFSIGRSLTRQLASPRANDWRSGGREGERERPTKLEASVFHKPNLENGIFSFLLNLADHTDHPWHSTGECEYQEKETIGALLEAGYLTTYLGLLRIKCNYTFGIIKCNNSISLA